MQMHLNLLIKINSKYKQPSSFIPILQKSFKFTRSLKKSGKQNFVLESLLGDIIRIAKKLYISSLAFIDNKIMVLGIDVTKYENFIIHFNNSYRNCICYEILKLRLRKQEIYKQSEFIIYVFLVCKT